MCTRFSSDFHIGIPLIMSSAQLRPARPLVLPVSLFLSLDGASMSKNTCTAFDLNIRDVDVTRQSSLLVLQRGTKRSGNASNDTIHPK